MARGSLNKVMIIGRLGQDPELKYTPQGSAVCTVSIATDEGYKDQSGNMVERTEWHRVVMWRKLAEIAGQYLRKGSLVYVEGKLSTRSYDKEGQKHYSTEIVADQMTMLGGKGDGSGSGNQSYDAPAQSKPAANQGKQQEDTPPAFDIPDTDFNDDDLPF
ncbi:MAG: single-stranded DNA-binding protein [Calditrichaeota bacterium]|nr:single-stranded DNA-binding protein [Calditrichota bacterium]